MKTLRLLATTAALLYAGLLALLYFMQATLLFPAPPLRNLALTNGAVRVEIPTADGVMLRAIHFPAAAGARNVLFLHGNGSSAGHEFERGLALQEAGYGVLLAEYRGYGGSTGKPSADGLRVDAFAAHDWLRSRSDTPVVVYAHSLGTGLAVEVAAQREVAALVLEAPYSSMADVVASHYPWVPVKLLFRHPIPAIDHIGKVRVPTLMIHGVRDTIIPIRFGERLFAAASGNATWVALPGAGHNSLLRNGSLDRVRSFLSGI